MLNWYVLLLIFICLPSSWWGRHRNGRRLSVHLFVRPSVRACLRAFGALTQRLLEIEFWFLQCWLVVILSMCPKIFLTLTYFQGHYGRKCGKNYQLFVNALYQTSLGLEFLYSQHISNMGNQGFLSKTIDIDLFLRSQEEKCEFCY